jgi:zinc protease
VLRLGVLGRHAVRGLVVFAALLVPANPWGAVPAAAQSAVPATGTLPSGVAYEIRADRAAPAAAVALWFRAPVGGFDAKPVAGFSRLAAATVSGSTPITGTPLARLVDRYGGRISVAAYPDSVAVTALVPADRVALIVRAMTAGYFAPVVTADGLQLARADVIEDARFRSYEPADAIEDALGAALFAKGPLHDGTIGTEQGLGGVSLERIRAFAERAFRPANAILVLTGNVDPAVLSAVAVRQGAQPGAEPAAPQEPRPAGAPLTRPGNAQGIGLGWVGPPIADEAAATALDFAADALFAPKTGTAQRALGSLKATVTGKFVTYRNPGVFLVTISGDDAAAARPLVERAVAAAAKPMDDAAFRSARAGFVYRLLGDMETPAELADTYGWYAVEGGASYAPAEGGAQGRYFAVAGSLTPAAVARTVARYLGTPPAVVTLVKSAPASPAQKRT